eukprot:1035229-Alexandrium_andersonii.AAC.1
MSCVDQRAMTPALVRRHKGQGRSGGAPCPLPNAHSGARLFLLGGVWWPRTGSGALGRRLAVAKRCQRWQRCATFGATH